MKIVIVDDEERIRLGLARLISGHPCWNACGIFSDSAAALDFLETEDCDVLITDIRMPGTSGLEMIRTLRKSHPKLPILILSGYSDFRYAQEAIELGVVKYMTKPTNTKELMAALEKIEATLPKEEEREEGEETSNLLVTRAIAYMEENYHKKIGLRDLADALYLSPNYLSELFKRHTGENFSDYLLRLRMHHAKRYLANIQYKISDVAGLVGFSDSRYFSSTFKRFYGLTPLEYRNKILSH